MSVQNSAAETKPSPRYGDPQFIDAYGASWGTTETLLSFFGPEAVYEDKVSGVRIQGHPMLRRFMKVYLSFSPNCVVNFTNVIKEPKGFAAEWTWTGNAQGALRLPDGETPANGAAFDVPGVSVCTVGEDGLIASHTDYWDAASLLRQLGR